MKIKITTVCLLLSLNFVTYAKDAKIHIETTGGKSPAINNNGGVVNINYSSKEEIDKIVAIYAQQHKLDTEQIKSLTAAVTALSQGKDVIGTESQIQAAMAALAQGNTTQAKALFEKETQRVELAAKQGAEAYRNLGALAFLDNTQEALHAYRRATELDPDNVDGWSNLGQLLVRVGDLDEAITTFNKVLVLSEIKQNKEEIAMAFGYLGSVYLIRGEFDKAIDMYKKDLQISETLENPKSMAMVYNNLGIVYKTKGDLDKAIEIYQKALELFIDIDNTSGMATVFGNLGVAYRLKGDLNKAIEMQTNSLGLHKLLKNKEGMLNAYGNIGNLFTQMGKLDSAIEMHSKALAISESLGYKEKMAGIYGSLGTVFQTRGELDKAIKMYQEALRIVEELDLKELKAVAYTNLGIIYQEKRNKTEARLYWQKGIELYKYIGSPMAKTVQDWLDTLNNHPNNPQ